MSMLFEVQFPWDHKFHADQQELLRRHSVTEVKFRDDAALELGAQPIITDEGMRALAPIPITVVRTVSNEATRALAAFGQRTNTVVNQRCEVAVPGLGVLAIDHVRVAEDLCTERLQEWLDLGWRILAVCVQPDQRRPDYVLGRSGEGKTP